MPWIPKLLNIWPAALAAAIAVPALLVLYFLKLRRREMPIASTLLWKKAIQDLQVNSPFQKLRRNLLLLLQLLLLILLLLALARPITFFTPGAGKNTVVIIDRSASMQARDIDGHSRLDEAKQRAKNLIDTLDRGSNAMVIAFDDGAETIQPWSSDTVALKHAIDGIEPTDRKSRLKDAYELASAQARFNPELAGGTILPPDIFVYSDGRVLDANELSVKGKLTYDKIGTDKAANIAILAMNARRNYERPNEVEVFARFGDFGTDPVSADVELWVAPIDSSAKDNDVFENRGAAIVKLHPQRWTDAQRLEAERQGNLAKDSVEFTLDLPNAAIIKVEQKNQKDDMLAADDTAQVVLPPPKPIALLTVTNGNPWLDYARSGLPVKDPVTMTPTDYEAKQPKDFDVIIFDHYSPKVLPPTGNFIYFGGIGPNLKLKPVMENGLQVMTGPMNTLDWNRDHSLLRGLLGIRSLFALEAMKLQVPTDSEVLVEGTQGPMVILHREGRSMHLVISFDLNNSNWPVGDGTKKTFPVFIYNAIQFMALGSDLDIRQSLQPGATPRIPRVNLQRADPNLKMVHLTGPGVSRDLPIPETGDFALPALDAVGVYRLTPAIPQYERLAVNLLDSNESNLLPLDHAPGNIGETVAATTGRSRLELWWWIIACGAIPLLLLEWWVYTRRVHL